MGCRDRELRELKDKGKVVIRVQHEGPLFAVCPKASSSFVSIGALSSEDFTSEAPLGRVSFD